MSRKSKAKPAYHIASRQMRDEADQIHAQNEQFRWIQGELERSRDRFATLFDHAPVGYVGLDGCGVIRKANQAALRMLWSRRELLLGCPMTAFVKGRTDMRLWLAHIRKCQSAQEPVITRLNLRPPKASGLEVLPVQLSTSVLEEDGGRLLLTAISDLSQQAAAEAALRNSQEALQALNGSLEERIQQRTAALLESERLKQAIFESFSAAIMVLDRHGVILEVNRHEGPWRQAAFFGTNRKCKALNYLEVCRRSAAAGHRAAAKLGSALGAILEGKDTGPFHLEYCSGEVGRRETWFAVTMTALANLSGAVVVFEDISERKNLERQLFESSQRERLALGRSLHEGLCQQMSGTAMMAFSLAHVLAEGPEKVRAAALAQSTRSALDATYAVAQRLYPVESKTCGLVVALKDMASRIGGRVRCTFTTRGDVDVRDSPSATAVYEIVKEYVEVTLISPQVTQLEITLERVGEHLAVCVSDDSGRVSRAGDGVLQMLRHRASWIGADLSVVSKGKRRRQMVCVLRLKGD